MFHYDKNKNDDFCKYLLGNAIESKIFRILQECLRKTNKSLALVLIFGLGKQ